MSIRDQILQSNDIDKELVDIPLWGVTVEVRGMSGSDRARIYDSVSENGEIKAGDLYAETVIATSYDPETGERIFNESDKIALMEKSAQAIDILAKVGLRLSGMGTEAQDEAGKSFLEESATTVSV